MPTPTPTQPEPMRQLTERTCDYLCDVADRAPLTLTPTDILNGVIAAASVSGIDLSVCHDEADVTAVMLAFLNAGRRTLIDEQRGNT